MYRLSDANRRDSNIELLRIVAMFMIVLNHMMCHGVMHAFDQSTRNLIWIKGSVFNKVCSSLLAVGGNKGVAVFFIITGYFMIKDPRVRLKKVVLETVFYGLLFSCLALVFIFCGYSFPGIKTSSFLINLVRSCMIPVSSGLWWFISAYILLILFHPLVNTFASKLSKDGFLAFLIFYYIIWYSIGIFCKAPFLYLQKGIFFYLVGGFIRLNYSTETMQNIKDKVSDNSRGGQTKFLCMFIVGWIISAITMYMSGETYFDKSLKSQILLQCLNQVDESIGVLLTSIPLFLFFHSLNVQQSGRVNTIAGSMLGVYLIHNHPFMRPLLWHTILKIDIVQYQSFLFPLYAIISGVIVFIIAVSVDLVRKIWVEPMMFRGCDYVLDRCKKNMRQN